METKKDKLKIFSLMCSDYFEVGVTLFKQNDLSIEEFIYWALNKSKWTINKKLYDKIMWVKDLLILGERLTLTLSWNNESEQSHNILLAYVIHLDTFGLMWHALVSSYDECIGDQFDYEINYGQVNPSVNYGEYKQEELMINLTKHVKSIIFSE